jgi:hypothetical protein
MEAQAQQVARRSLSYSEVLDLATETIRRAREMTHALMREGFIATPPEIPS